MIRRVLNLPQEPIADGGGVVSRQWARFFQDVVTRLSKDIEEVSEAYAVTSDDQLVFCDATGGAFTVTLPTVAGLSGRVYTVKKIDASANAITVAGNGFETIDGAATQSLAAQWDSITIVNDGAEWFIV